jgi:hypothetical protein
MNGPHADILDDVAVYALGTLPHHEAEVVRQHLETCADCREEYEALAPAVASVAKSAEACTDPVSGAVYASPLLKARIMREVRGAPQQRKPPVWPAYSIAAASLIVALGLGWNNVSLMNRLHTEETAATHANAPAGVDEATLSDLVNEKAKRYTVPGGEIVRSNNHLYIAMHDMAKPPEGKVYQAWTETKGSKTMVAGPTFVPDNRGVAILPVSSDASALKAMAVSVEPPGGSKAPTTSPVILELLE